MKSGVEGEAGNKDVEAGMDAVLSMYSGEVADSGKRDKRAVDQPLTRFAFERGPASCP